MSTDDARIPGVTYHVTDDGQYITVHPDDDYTGPVPGAYIDDSGRLVVNGGGRLIGWETDPSGIYRWTPC